MRENRFRGSPVAWWELKRDVVGRFGLGRVGAISEQTHLQRYDLSPIAGAAPVLRLVLTGSEPTLDVNLTAFAQESLAGIRKRSECDYAMPFGTLLLGTAPIRETLGRGLVRARDRSLAGRSANSRSDDNSLRGSRWSSLLRC